MPISTIQLFEQAVAGLQRTMITGDYKNGISTAQFAQLMFEVAEEAEFVTCNMIDENHLCFVMGNEKPRLYEIPSVGMFRPVLAAIAHVFWSQNTPLPDFQKFNAYGDKQEISYTNNDGLVARFQAETANTNGKALFFAIHKLPVL